MKSTFRLDNVDEMQATMTLTMPVREWRKLNAQLAKDWPSWDFSRQITDLIRAAEVHFHTDTEASTRAPTGEESK